MNTVVIAVRRRDGSLRRLPVDDWCERTPSVREETVSNEDELRLMYGQLFASLDGVTQQIIMMGLDSAGNPAGKLGGLSSAVFWLRANHNQV